MIQPFLESLLVEPFQRTICFSAFNTMTFGKSERLKQEARDCQGHELRVTTSKNFERMVRDIAPLNEKSSTLRHTCGHKKRYSESPV